MALQTLRSMAGGGIYDQIGGGFARYSTDAAWTVPHFEKMLYDNALLARAYLHGWQVCGDPVLRRTAEETLDWVLREMTRPRGRLLLRAGRRLRGRRGQVLRLAHGRAARRRSATDADDAIRWFGASDQGNFEGQNILESRGAEPAPEVRERIRAKLLHARARRAFGRGSTTSG